MSPPNVQNLRFQIPKAERFVPGSGESELSIGRDDDVRDEVAVSGKSFDRASNGSALNGSIDVYVPDQNRLI